MHEYSRHVASGLRGVVGQRRCRGFGSNQKWVLAGDYSGYKMVEHYRPGRRQLATGALHREGCGGVYIKQ